MFSKSSLTLTNYPTTANEGYSNVLLFVLCY